MAVSFKDFIYNCYHSRFGTSVTFSRRRWDTINYSDSNAFVKYIKIPINSDTIEIPCIYKYMVMDAIAANKLNPETAIDSLYIPMMCLENDSVESRTSNALLRKFLYDTAGYSNLTRKRGNGTVYLGGEGIILYEDFTPIIMLSLEVKRDDKGKYIPVRQIARINPIIYSRSDILAKFIKTKFITGLVEMRLSDDEIRDLNQGYWVRSNKIKLIDNARLLTTKVVDYNFKIILDDFSNFFFSPKVPDATFNSTKVNDMILQEISQKHIKYDI